jgi:hypothetical protein
MTHEVATFGLDNVVPDSWSFNSSMILRILSAYVLRQVLALATCTICWNLELAPDTGAGSLAFVCTTRTSQDRLYARRLGERCGEVAP